MVIDSSMIAYLELTKVFKSFSLAFGKGEVFFAGNVDDECTLHKEYTNKTLILRNI